MIRIREIALSPEHSEHQLTMEAAKLLKLTSSKIKKVKIVRRSIDARKKPDVKFVYTVDVVVDGNEEKILAKSGCKRADIAGIKKYDIPLPTNLPKLRPVVIGFGPAGMFAALVLSMAGLKPLVVERGEDAVSRNEKIKIFFKTGKLDIHSNVQFGEGGAGTFSDGKLNTGVNNIRNGWILKQFVEAGAQENILYDAKPHMGTDVLLTVVQNIRKRIIDLGGEVCFNSQVTNIKLVDNAITSIEIDGNEWIDCNKVILAIGHSARDTFEMLRDTGVPMERKPFAMGVRIEHLQSAVDKAQYGQNSPLLPPADYKLVQHLNDDTVYSFCMCPGGHVVAATSEEGRVVTNGMSYSDRSGDNANSALLVTVKPEEFIGDDVLAGMYWQRQIEEKAFRIGGSNYYAPAQKVGDFINGKASTGPGKVQPTYKPGVTWCDLHDVLPKKITSAIKEALPRLNSKLNGFADKDAVMTAPETRSSSPVSIVRGDDRQSIGINGLYPCGEGAGYAGGIMSAAIDGIRCAEAVIEQI